MIGGLRAVREARKVVAAATEAGRQVEADSLALLASVGGTESHVLYAQQFARAVGVPLPTTGKLDAHTSRFVATFQTAFCYGKWRDEPLTVDGIPGPLTRAAMAASKAIGYKVSENFGFAEYVTNGDRTFTDRNPVVLIDRKLALGMQNLRDFYRRPVRIVSGYRSPAWNDAVGGARKSQHLAGRAADFHVVGADGLKATAGPLMPTEQVCARWFDGLGIHRQSGRVSHVDVRGWRARWNYSGR